ncbi:histidine triad nucleotide-binding protein [Solwaraspora sp. WMMD937]|uniref:histidine triad nucleotide-binding protein n=1 Tax=Solwaraspora sp. WMMD937 TaxID=3016090 RepID=UPI00249BAFE5|nr:histidine triad nucleotide-binding protein [Solwaraspora sp. WMMD937]WFE24712.1 histidine triad nucleotide-binding protein [Solwaraspora sp. WMMD937]
MRVSDNCVFCRIAAGELPTTLLYEGANTVAFRDLHPQAPTHVLVIPKQHHPDVAALATADPAVAGELLTTAAAVAQAEGLTADGFRLIFNTGRYAGQEVFHVHAHVLGGAPLGPLLSR